MALTAMQEAFAQAVITEDNHSKAYRIAYPNSVKWKDEAVHVNACKLAKNTKVALRIAELKESVSKRHEITVDSMIAEFIDAEVFARECKNPSSVVKAKELKGKLVGLFIEKIEHSGKVEIEAMRQGIIENAKEKARNL